MFEIKIWVQVLKALKISDKDKEELLSKNLNLFESLLYKISKVKQDFEEKKDLSVYEIEAYSRLITNISTRLAESWEEIAHTTIEILKSRLKLLLESHENAVKRVKITLKCCRVIKRECNDTGKIKRCYLDRRIEKSLLQLEELEDFVLSKYF